MSARLPASPVSSQRMVNLPLALTWLPAERPYAVPTAALCAGPVGSLPVDTP